MLREYISSLLVLIIITRERFEKMVQYLSLREYSERTNRSIASVYRDAEKGIVKTTMIKGKKHIILEESQDKEKIFDNSSEKIKERNSHFNKIDKEYQEAEIINDSPGIRYELEVFKSSILTIEEMASRIEAAKDETISNLKIDIEKKDKIIDNQNEIIKTLSSDNSSLRTQLGIRESEIKILEKRVAEIENNNNELVDKIENIEKNNIVNEKNSFWLLPRKL